MFGKRDVEVSPRRFWSWFASEAAGIRNALEALQRGEADAEWAIIGLNERIRRYDASLEADIVRGLDGSCQMIVSGGAADSVSRLLDAAPALYGWKFVTRFDQAEIRRVPFRVAPRPSMDALAAPISARHEAYAV
ncbi:MAG: hypothetical protein Q8R02_24440 [Hyphomonadaceae bacterium]|nr:hypothetical protein [Hyphomonadaceae bacterium]